MPITIDDYDENWPRMYAEAEAELYSAIGPYVLEIQHIGSTSVPGLAAKPIIDILIGVESLAIADAHCVSGVINLGYVYLPEFEVDTPFRRYFRKSDPSRTAFHPLGNTRHIHLVEFTHWWWTHHIAFRDYLRAHPDTAHAYGELKKQIAPHHTNGNEYNADKEAFILEVTDLALEWYANQTTASE